MAKKYWVSLTEGASYTSTTGRKFVAGRNVLIEEGAELERIRLEGGRFRFVEARESVDGELVPPGSQQQRGREQLRREASDRARERAQGTRKAVESTKEDDSAAAAGEASLPVDTAPPRPPTSVQDPPPRPIPEVKTPPGGKPADPPDVINPTPPIPPTSAKPPEYERLVRLSKIDVSDPDIKIEQLVKIGQEMKIELPFDETKKKPSKADREELIARIQKRQTSIIADSQVVEESP